MNGGYLFLSLPDAEHRGYAVACRDSGECLAVDPPPGAGALEEFLQDNGLTLRTVVLTSGRRPLAARAEELRRKYPQARLAAHPASGLLRPGDRELQHEDVLFLGRLRVRVLATPGEPAGDISLFLPFGPGAVGSVLSGRALLAGGLAECAGAAERRALVAAVRRHLFTLGDGVRVYAAWGPPSTIGVERHHNPAIE